MIGHKKRHQTDFLSNHFVTIGFIVFAIFTYLYWAAPIEITAKIGNYIQVLTLVIFTITGIVTVQTFRHQSDDRARMAGIQYVNLTQGVSSDIDKVFMNNPHLDRLYFQMYSHDPNIGKIAKMKGPMEETPEMLKMEHIAAGIIFQKIADIYACEQLDNYNDDCIEWINMFRSWMKSPILRSHWVYLKYEMHPDVRHFVENCLIKGNKFINSNKMMNNMSNKKIVII